LRLIAQRAREQASASSEIRRKVFAGGLEQTRTAMAKVGRLAAEMNTAAQGPHALIRYSRLIR